MAQGAARMARKKEENDLRSNENSNGNTKTATPLSSAGLARTSLSLSESVARNMALVCAIERLSQSEYIENLIRGDLIRRRLDPDMLPKWDLLGGEKKSS